MDNLKSLLSSIDVDNRAKFAIQAYKQAIHSFPPSNKVCEVLSLLKKCPASISALLLQCHGGEDPFLKSALLLPFIFIEVIRMLDWTESIGEMYCSPYASEEASVVYSNVYFLQEYSNLYRMHQKIGTFLVDAILFPVQIKHLPQ